MIRLSLTPAVPINSISGAYEHRAASGGGGGTRPPTGLGVITAQTWPAEGKTDRPQGEYANNRYIQSKNNMIWHDIISIDRQTEKRLKGSKLILHVAESSKICSLTNS